MKEEDGHSAAAGISSCRGQLCGKVTKPTDYVCDGLSAVPEMRFLKGLMILYGICILGFLRGSVKI